MAEVSMTVYTTGGSFKSKKEEFSKAMLKQTVDFFENEDLRSLKDFSIETEDGSWIYFNPQQIVAVRLNIVKEVF